MNLIVVVQPRSRLVCLGQGDLPLGGAPPRVQARVQGQVQLLVRVPCDPVRRSQVTVCPPLFFFPAAIYCTTYSLCLAALEQWPVLVPRRQDDEEPRAGQARHQCQSKDGEQIKLTCGHGLLHPWSGFLFASDRVRLTMQVVVVSCSTSTVVAFVFLELQPL